MSKSLFERTRFKLAMLKMKKDAVLKMKQIKLEFITDPDM